MVKTLNEAGLVHYEPYVGVKLLPDRSWVLTASRWPVR